MRFEQLHLFATILSCGSFAAAGRLLHLSQPSITASLSALETEVGQRLLERTPGQRRPVRPTAAGEIFATFARKALADYRGMLSAVTLSSDAPQTPVRIGVTPTPGSSLLPVLTNKFREENPTLTVQVKTFRGTELARRLKEGEFDLGVTGTRPQDEGIVFDRGFLSPKMATDELQSVAELHAPYILLCDAKFTDPQDLIPALILAAEDERSCLIVSDGVEGDAMGLVLKNKIEGDMDIVCVTAPLYGEGRKWRMEDLAVQTGGTYITKELGENAAYVKVTRQQTIITGAGGNPDMVQNRIQELQYLVGHTDYEFNRQRYRERLATFVSGVAKISVGGRTEPEIWERKMRAEDAVHAARAAYEEGVVPGGGTALLNLIPQVQALAASLTGDEQTGARAVAEALAVPARQIFENAGLDGNALLARLMEQKDGFGYDVCRDEFVDMLAYGISDPVKVTRLALECALSASATLLTTQSSVTAKK